MTGFGIAHERPASTTFRLLGALELGPEGALARLGGPRQRAVLAALLLRANDTASIGYLTRAAWADPPVAPESNLRTYIAGLRRALRDVGDDAARLRTRPTGYSLAVYPGELDAARFEELAAQGTRSMHASDLAAAAELFGVALDLWRGQPLEGQVVGPALHAEIARLQDRRFAVIEQFCRVRLELGDHAELAGELQWLVNEYPLREDLAAQLMFALYRCGRQAEALDVFRQTRGRLVDELGIEPGDRLTRLHQEILQAHVGSAHVGSAHIERAPVEKPRHLQVPMDINDFTGRREELARLHRLVAGGHAAEICVIEGMAGVGKTRLAIHAAHRFAQLGEYDDVQLWADLRGFDRALLPADPGTVLETFLHALGIPAERIPQDLDERAALYREQLSGKRALVLLDNAADEDQVRPLLPGGPECLVLVTTRRSLGGLDGALSLALDVFGAGEAIELLGRILGADRIADEPEAVARIAALCGYLPLAVTLAARRLRSRRCWKLADLADRLADHRLDQLSAGSREVRAVFELSYRALPGEHRRLFRALGLHPGEDFTARSAGAIAGMPPKQAELIMDALLDAYLLEQITPGRYRFHDLVRDYARERVLSEDGEAALGRLLGWYLYAADAADRALQPHRRRVQLDPAGAPRDAMTFSGRTDAAAWLAGEHANLVNAVHAAADHGHHRIAWQLPAALLGWFYLRKPWDDWLRTYGIALASARRLGDLTGQAVTLNGLGVAYTDLSQYGESIACHREALAIERAAGDRAGQAWNLNNLGVAYCDIDRPRDAADCFHEALVLHRETGSCHGQGIALSNLGDAFRALNQLDTAMGYLEQALDIQRANDDDAGQRFTLSCIGDVCYARRQLDAAIDNYRLAVDASRAVGDPWQVAMVLTRLARPLRDSGRSDAAQACVGEAQAILENLGGHLKADRIRAQIGALTSV